MDWSIIPKSCPLQTSVALQEAALTLEPGSAFAKSDFCAVIVVFAEFRLKKVIYISPVIAERDSVRFRVEKYAIA